MRNSTLILVLAFIVLSCNKATKETEGSDSVKVEKAIEADSEFTPTDSIVDFLIASSIEDFKKQAESSNFEFRNAHIGYKVTETGAKQFVLCGEFQRKEDKSWTPFATLKTSDYEQWQGGQALMFCQDTTVMWDGKNDLSGVIQEGLSLGK